MIAKGTATLSERDAGSGSTTDAAAVAAIMSSGGDLLDLRWDRNSPPVPPVPYPLRVWLRWFLLWQQAESDVIRGAAALGTGLLQKNPAAVLNWFAGERDEDDEFLFLTNVLMLSNKKMRAFAAAREWWISEAKKRGVPAKEWPPRARHLPHEEVGGWMLVAFLKSSEGGTHKKL